MIAYIFRRLLLMIPTLIGVVTITFAVTTQHPCAGRSNALDAAVRSVMSGPAGYHISDRSMLLGRADHATLGLHANDR